MGRWLVRALLLLVVGLLLVRGPEGETTVVVRSIVFAAVVVLVIRDHFRWLPSNERRDRRALLIFAGFWLLLLGVAGLGALFGRPF